MRFIFRRGWRGPHGVYSIVTVLGLAVVGRAFGEPHNTEQKAALAPLEKYLAGGKAVWDWNGNVSIIFFSSTSTASDVELENLKHFVGLRHLALSGTRFTDAAFANLRGLDRLEDLSASKHPDPSTGAETLPFGDAGLCHLQGLTCLKRLSYFGEVSDAGLECLRDLRGLRELRVGCGRATDRGLASFGKLDHLEKLVLVNREVMTGEGLVVLPAPARLKTLLLLHVTEAGMRTLRRFSRLRELSIGGKDITTDGLLQLCAMKSLESLSLENAPLNDRAIEQSIAQMTWLKELRISRCPVSDSAVKHLRDLNDLEVLTISASGVDDESARDLAEFKNLRVLNVSGTALTKASLPQLLEMRKLEDLTVPFSLEMSPDLRRRLEAAPRLLRLKTPNGEFRFPKK